MPKVILLRLPLCRIQSAHAERRESGGGVDRRLLGGRSWPEHPGVLPGLGHAQDHFRLQGKGTRQVRVVVCLHLFITLQRFILSRSTRGITRTAFRDSPDILEAV